MADFDVSLRLGVDYRPGGADRAERDLRDLSEAARRLGAQNGGDKLARDLTQAGNAAGETRRKIGDLREAQARLGGGQGASDMRSDIRAIGTAADRAERKVDELRAAKNRLGEGQGAIIAKQHIVALGGAIGEAQGAAGGLDTSLRSAVVALGAYVAPAAVLAGLNNLAEGFRQVDYAAASAAATAGLLDPETRARYVETGKRLGVDLGAPQAEIQAARDVFKGVGLADPQTESATLAPTLRAAIASGAQAGTVAQAGAASINAFKIRPDQLPAAYDMMLMGTKLGSVEMEDLARNLPALGTQYASAGGIGQGGLKGLSELIALMEVSAKGASSPDEAANNLQNYLSNMFSPEAVGNFGEKGVDLAKLVADARAKGQHPAAAILDQVEKMTGGDAFKMGELFGDQQVGAALRALMQNRATLDEWTKRIATDSAGTTQRDFDYMNSTPGGQERRRAAQREVSQLAIGEAVEPGAARASEAWTRVLGDMAGLAEAFQKEGALSGTLKLMQAHPLLGGDQSLALRYFGGRTGEEAPKTPQERLASMQAEAAQKDARLGTVEAELAKRRAEPFISDIVGTAALEDELRMLRQQSEQLRSAIQSLASQLANGIQVAPITFNGAWPGAQAATPAVLGGGSGNRAASPAPINANASGGGASRSAPAGRSGGGLPPGMIAASLGGGFAADPDTQERLGAGEMMRPASAANGSGRNGQSRSAPAPTPAPMPAPLYAGGMGRSMTINNTFHGADPRVLADRAMLAQKRAIRMAHASAMHDTALPIA